MSVNKTDSNIILHLCADIGSDSYFFKEAGYDVRCIGKDIGVENYTPPEEVFGIIANPVCTEFSIARGFNTKTDTDKGMYLVNHCFRIINQCKKSFYVIENPASGKLGKFIGAPHHTYQPWWYGDPWTKKTALWGEFVMPIRKYYLWDTVPKNNKLYVRPGRPKPSLAFMHKSAIFDIPAFSPFKVDDDMSFRSLCPQGFAKAFYNSNKRLTDVL